MPARYAQDARNAFLSSFLKSSNATPARPATASAGKTNPHVHVLKFVRICGCTWKVMPVTTAVSASTPHHDCPPSFAARSLTAPLVFMRTHKLPCITSASNASTPVRIVYQSRIPVCSPSRKSVHNDSKKYPLASSGTPRTTLPSAAPKNTASSALEPQNKKSHKGSQTAL